MKCVSILIVDDDEAIRDTLRMTLEHEGYTVDLAHDGIEALKRLETLPKPILILLVIQTLDTTDIAQNQIIDLLLLLLDDWEVRASVMRHQAKPKGTGKPQRHRSPRNRLS